MSRQEKVLLQEEFRVLWNGTVAKEVLGKTVLAAALLDQKRITLKGDMGAAVRRLKYSVPVQWGGRGGRLDADEVKVPFDEVTVLVECAQEYCRRRLDRYLEEAVELRNPDAQLLFNPKLFFRVAPFVMLPPSDDDGLDRYAAHILWECGVLLKRTSRSPRSRRSPR